VLARSALCTEGLKPLQPDQRVAPVVACLGAAKAPAERDADAMPIDSGTGLYVNADAAPD
jgi:hypothetical protein